MCCPHCQPQNSSIISPPLTRSVRTVYPPELSSIVNPLLSPTSSLTESNVPVYLPEPSSIVHSPLSPTSSLTENNVPVYLPEPSSIVQSPLSSTSSLTENNAPVYLPEPSSIVNSPSVSSSSFDSSFDTDITRRTPPIRVHVNVPHADSGPSFTEIRAAPSLPVLRRSLPHHHRYYLDDGTLILAVRSSAFFPSFSVHFLRCSSS
jgi:hypothetical protein